MRCKTMNPAGHPAMACADEVCGKEAGCSERHLNLTKPLCTFSLTLILPGVARGFLSHRLSHRWRLSDRCDDRRCCYRASAENDRRLSAGRAIDGMVVRRLFHCRE